MSLLLPDAGLLFWMLLAFGVVFYVLYKYGFPIITSMIDARKQYIDEALKGAKEANEKIADIEQQCNGLIEEVRQRQVEILREATAAREQIIKEAREKADAETERIIAAAKREIEQQREDAMNAVREEAAKVAVRCMKECIDVGHATGAEFAPVQGKNITALFYYTNPVKRFIGELLIPIAMKKHRDIEPSMLQDIKHGKPCEVDAINGVVCDFGKKYGVKTPINDRIVEVIKKIQAGELEASKANYALFKDLL